MEIRDLGIKSLLLDVDGTLISRNTNEIPDKVKKWVLEAKKIFSIYLISNNPSKDRIASIADKLGLEYKNKAFKPRKKYTQEVIKKLNQNSENIALIGDRIFTDIVVANRCNIKSILVLRLNKQGIPIKFNLTLIFEKIISLLIF